MLTTTSNKTGAFEFIDDDRNWKALPDQETFLGYLMKILDNDGIVSTRIIEGALMNDEDPFTQLSIALIHHIIDQDRLFIDGEFYMKLIRFIDAARPEDSARHSYVWYDEYRMSSPMATSTPDFVMQLVLRRLEQNGAKERHLILHAEWITRAIVAIYDPYRKLQELGL